MQVRQAPKRGPLMPFQNLVDQNFGLLNQMKAFADGIVRLQRSSSGFLINKFC